MAAELGSTVVSGVASKGAELLFDSIKQNISYVFKYQSHVEALRSRAKELENKREMIEQPVIHARRQGDEIYKGVDEWLIRVDEFTGNVVKLITDDEDKSKNPCFKGLCLNLYKRYNLSKKAVKAAKEGADLLGRGNFSTVVSYRPAPDKLPDMHVRGYQQFDSRLKIFQDVMEALKDSTNEMIGVYGMGGVGKTTLVKQVAKQVMEDKLFDEVVMAEVTQTLDHKTIQDKLARDLGLEFSQSESTVVQRADRLRRRLKKHKQVLVILDNIWTKLELYEVGIPFGDDENNERKDNERRCTIILTSRSRELLSDDMNSPKNFCVEVLSNEEAEQLFEKIASDKTKKSDFQPIAVEIVERCGGLPVALKTIANALKNKSLPIWKNALSQLKNFNLREIHGMDANVYTSIELSYKFLENKEAKDLFLLCALHPAGDRIRVPYLLRYGMGLDLFKNVYTLEAARNRVHSLIDSLIASSLLLDDDTEDCVKMHDIIHDVAVSIATEGHMFNIPNVDDLKEEIEKTIQKGPAAISLPWRDVLELPERLACPKLKLLFLFANSYLQIPDLIFEGMGELRVLDWNGINFPSLPSSLGHLINLQTLCLDGCQLEDVAIIGELTKLEILSFRGSDIKKLPVVIGQLTRLRLLDLRDCRELEVIAPNVISKLSRLEELYMGMYSFTRWAKIEGRSNASLVELKGLSKLTTLDIFIPDAQIVQHDLFPAELERYWIRIGNIICRLGEYEKESRSVRLEGLEKSILLGHMMKMLLKRTKYLFLKEQKGFHNVFHELDDGEGFQQLRHLHVNECSEVLHIASSVGQVGCSVFPLLESLYLKKLVNLEKIYHDELIDDQSFSNLKIMNISYCHKLTHLFSFSMAKNLLQLQEIYVSNCKNLNLIVGPDVENQATASTSKEIIAGNSPNEKVIFPSLAKLIVEDCKSLKCIFSYSTVRSLVRLQHLKISDCISMEWVFDTTSIGLQFPSLLQLKIFGCPNLKRFISMSSLEDNIHIETQPQPALFDEKVGLPNLEVLTIGRMNDLREIWHHELASDSFTKLKELDIWCCPELMYIFPQMVIFPSLVKFTVEKCERLKSMFSCSMKRVLDTTSTGLDRDERKLFDMFFPKLQYLHLYSLPKLTSFFMTMGIHLVEFPSLLQLYIRKCPNLRRSINMSSWETQPQLALFDEKVGLPSLELLTIECIKNLREIWHHQLASGSFNKLKKLDILSCDELMIILPPMVALPSLEILTILWMKNLKEIWHHQIAYDSFSKLKKLDIMGCDELMNIFPPMMEFPNLVSLSISRCNKINEIIGPIGEVQENLIAFIQLKYLTLDELPRLTSFCLGNYTLQFPSLVRVSVRCCPNMKIFSKGVLYTPKLHRVIDSYNIETSVSEDVQSYWEGNLNSTIQKLFKEMVGFRNIETLKLSLFPRLREMWHGQELPVSFFSNLRSLVVDNCTNMSSAIPANLLRCLNNLEVRNCDSLEAVFHLEELSADEQFGPIFPRLHHLKLIDLPKLTRFCNFTGNIVELPSLGTMRIENCPKMVTFISDSTHMISDKESQEMTTEQNAMLADIKPLFDEKVSFPRLRKLKLFKLPELMHLLKGNSQHREGFQNLKTLEVSECGKLEDLLLVSFQNLKTLKVSKCDGLLNLVTLSTAESLVKLVRMNITDCKKIEKIIQHVGVEMKKDCIVFDQLKDLRLHCLPNLACFCLGNHTLEFPSLKRVVVRECPKMKTFSHKVQVEEEEEEHSPSSEEEEEHSPSSSEEEGINLLRLNKKMMMIKRMKGVGKASLILP